MVSCWEFASDIYTIYIYTYIRSIQILGEDNPCKECSISARVELYTINDHRITRFVGSSYCIATQIFTLTHVHVCSDHSSGNGIKQFNLIKLFNTIA